MTDRTDHDARQRRIRRRLRRGAVSPVLATRASVQSPIRGGIFWRRWTSRWWRSSSLLLAIGSLMVFSSTWDWSNKTYGTATGFFVEEHLRNVVVSVLALVIFAAIDYRFWKRFAFWLLLVTIVLLVAVLAFGEVIFGAKRSFTDGRLQPGELAEFAIVLYMAAWLGSKSAKVDSVLLGMLPFLFVVGMVSFLIIQQPDLSSAAIVALTAGVMFFVAGANILQMDGGWRDCRRRQPSG